MGSSDLLTSDVLVIGTGISGLFFSLKAAKYASINLVTKTTISDTATSKAQGGIATVMSAEDSFESHIKDTLRVGDGLCHPDVVEQIVKDGPKRVQELIDIGVEFCKEEDCAGPFEKVKPHAGN